MNLPKVKQKRRETVFQQEFRGLNENIRTETGEFNSMESMSLDNYPVISTRHGVNNQYFFQGNINALHEIAENLLIAIIGRDLVFIGSEENDVEIYKDQFTDSEKSLATIGSKTVVMPDGKIIDISESDWTPKPIERNVRSKSYNHYDYDLMVRTIPCDIEGNTAWERGNRVSEFNSAPLGPNDGDWWYDMTNDMWKEYDGEAGKWVDIELGYTKLIPVLTTSGWSYVEKENPSDEAIQDLDDVRAFFELFEPLDTISVFLDGGHIPIFIESTDYTVYALVENHAISYPGITHTKDIVINRKADHNIGYFVFQRKCPELEHLVASNNRIWGYDRAYNELKACKLGDPTQWYNYSGTAADSYAVSLGNYAEVTASIEYNNYVHFFTEDSIIKVYGDYPSNYQIRAIPAEGVLRGAHDTVVQVGGNLFWLSPIGVVAYDGSLPYFIGQKFLPDRILPAFPENAVLAAGKDGTKYILSISGMDAYYPTYSYDTKLNAWSCEPGWPFKKASEFKNSLCFLTSPGGHPKFFTTHEKWRETDRVYGEDFLLVGYRPKGSGMEYRSNQYYAPVTIDQDNALDAISAEYDSTVTVDDGVITVTALADYWSGGTKKNSGAAYPVDVLPGKNYYLTYETDDNTNRYVTVTFRDKDGNPIEDKTYYNVAAETELTAPEGAEWAVVIFGQHALTPNNYSDIVFCEVREEAISWDLTSGLIGLDTPNQKYISRIQLRLEFKGSIQIDIQYDNDDLFTNVYVANSKELKSVTVPIKVKRCDHFRFRVMGLGQAKIYSMGYQLSEGSDRCLI